MNDEEFVSVMTRVCVCVIVACMAIILMAVSFAIAQNLFDWIRT